MIQATKRHGGRGLEVAAGVWLLALMMPAEPGFASDDIWGYWERLGDYPEGFQGAGPPVGDYEFLPLTADARMRGESWDPGMQVQPQRQCFPHSAVWAPFGPTPLEIRDEGEVIIIRMQSNEVLRRIWMDGRPHPSAHGLHSWNGFSTGEWVGETLKITTTHIKEGFIRRNGIANSDRAVLTEYITRHDNYLADIVVLEDPVYLTEPLVREQSYVRLPDATELLPYPCERRWPVELGPEPFHFTPHFLPGQNPFLQQGVNRADTFND